MHACMYVYISTYNIPRGRMLTLEIRSTARPPKSTTHQVWATRDTLKLCPTGSNQFSTGTCSVHVYIVRIHMLYACVSILYVSISINVYLRCVQ
jgi:hypothetical protein